jgi:hypothetical protein
MATRINLPNLVELYKSGLSTYALAEKFGCNRTCIARRLKENLIPLRSIASVDIDKDYIIELYNENFTINGISLIIGCDKSSVYSCLRRNNVTLSKRTTKNSLKNDEIKRNKLLKEEDEKLIKDLYSKYSNITKISSITGFGYSKIRSIISKNEIDVKLPTKENNLRWRGHGEISGDDWCKILSGAKKRNIAVSISIEDAWKQWQKQNGLCAYSGEELKFGLGKSKTASLDRTNSKLSYSVDNIQWIHKQINIMQWGVPDDQFIELCDSVHKHNSVNINHSSTKTSKCVSRDYFSRLRSSAKYRKIKFDLTYDALNDLFISQNGLCYLSGIELNFETKIASVDRVDSDIPYIISNVKWTHKYINKMKLNLHKNKFINICTDISVYQKGLQNASS